MAVRRGGGGGGAGARVPPPPPPEIFMPPPRRAPEALCFRVVRPSVRTRISLTRNLKNPLVDFHHTWPRGAPWRVDELIGFWARSAQGQRSMNLV